MARLKLLLSSLLLSSALFVAQSLSTADLTSGQQLRSQVHSIPKFKVGQLMEYQVLEGEGAGSWVKCSITGVGSLPDTYNVYAWSADPRHRNLMNIPEVVLRTQAEQDARRKAVADEDERVRAEIEAEQRAKDEAERQLREEEAARRKAREEAERKAKQEAEELERAEEEARRLAEEAEARRVAKEEARIQAEKEAKDKADADEAARQRKIRLKARWEEVKAMKHQQDLEEKAREQEEQRQRLADLAERRARGEKITTTPRPLQDPENIRVTLRLDGKEDVQLKVRRSLRLRSLMSVGAEKMGLNPDYVRFILGSKVLSPDETAERFGHHDRVTVRMEPLTSREIASAQRVAKRPGVSLPQSVSPGSMSPLEIGDFVSANSTDSRGGSLAVPCTIRAKGAQADSYDVHFIFSTGGDQDMRNVPAKLLQKVRGKEYANAVKFFRENHRDAQATVQSLKHLVEMTIQPVHQHQKAPPELPTEAPELAHELPSPEPEPKEPEEAFEVGNFVNLMLVDGSTLPATVTMVNPEPVSYDIHFLFAPDPEMASMRDLHSLPARYLHRLKATPFVSAVKQLKEDQEKALDLLKRAHEEFRE